MLSKLSTHILGVLLTCMLCQQSVQAAALVSVEPAKNLLFYPERSAPAEVVALNKSLVPAELAAKVKSIQVNVGQSVQQGQLLVALDCQNSQLQLTSEQARLQQLSQQSQYLEREYLRGKELAEQKNIGKAELDLRLTAWQNSQAQVNAQQAASDLAKLNVARCHITAPFAGIITKRLVSQSEMIEFGKPVLELLDNENLEVSAGIALADKSSFSQAKAYQFVADNQVYPVNFQTFVALIASGQRSQEARFTFNQAKPLAGITGMLVWQSKQAYLPAHLLLNRNGNHGYFILTGNTAKFIEVADAQEGRPLTFVLSPLVNENTLIITDGRHSLQDGEQVSVVSSKTPAGVN